LPTVSVLGAGSWGTALAVLLARNGAEVRLWGHLPADIERLRGDRENRQFLPGIALPERVSPESDLEATLAGVQYVLLVVPSHAFRAVVQEIAPRLDKAAAVAWATKGFEPGTGLLLHEVAGNALPNRDLAVLSGPSFAGEVARGLPTAITIAATRDSHGERLARYLHCDAFRAYTTADLVGVQVGGAAKNVMAIAAGIADGLGFGANSRAALITRGLAEITRLGLALGGRPETFMGLAGLGDLALTCTDNQSRNRRMGLALARGLTVAEARAEIGQEVEGVATAREVWRKSCDLGVEMPITEQTYRVLYEGLGPLAAVQALLGRRQRPEAD
jgi:glycerol-3-phosphate dehydrogenase (NAD(P)+)